MPLQSQLFAGDPKLEKALDKHAGHVTPGSQGEHVARIQTALFLIDGLSVDPSELRDQFYGKSTAAAVLAYKKKRRIINFAYQTTEDNIVGKMTIAALDRDVRSEEAQKADFPLAQHDKDFI
jgi:peptidoglycan hydrolase-like protein with peptidoglycan-binding domain